MRLLNCSKPPVLVSCELMLTCQVYVIIAMWEMAARGRYRALLVSRVRLCLHHLSVCTFNYVSGMLKGARWSEKLEQ